MVVLEEVGEEPPAAVGNLNCPLKVVRRQDTARIREPCKGMVRIDTSLIVEKVRQKAKAFSEHDYKNWRRVPGRCNGGPPYFELWTV